MRVLEIDYKGAKNVYMIGRGVRVYKMDVSGRKAIVSGGGRIRRRKGICRQVVHVLGYVVLESF